MKIGGMKLGLTVGVEAWVLGKLWPMMSCTVVSRHNLDRMHLSRWWGENQFCPSDRHPPTVNR